MAPPNFPPGPPVGPPPPGTYPMPPPGYPGPMPPPFYPPPGFILPPRRNSIPGAAVGAVVCWVLLIVRDIFVALLFQAEGWRFLMPLSGMGDIDWWSVVPLAGAVAAGIATFTLLRGQSLGVGMVAATAALAMGSFPGIALFGPFGLGIGVAAWLLQLSATKKHASAPWGRPPQPAL